MSDLSVPTKTAHDIVSELGGCVVNKDIVHCHIDQLMALVVKQAKRIEDLERYNSGLGSESHERMVKLESANKTIFKLEQMVICKNDLVKALKDRLCHLGDMTAVNSND